MVKRRQLEIQPLVARSLKAYHVEDNALKRDEKTSSPGGTRWQGAAPGGSPLKLSTDGLQRLEGMPRSATSNASR